VIASERHHVFRDDFLRTAYVAFLEWRPDHFTLHHSESCLVVVVCGHYLASSTDGKLVEKMMTGIVLPEKKLEPVSVSQDKF
jgi:hypothetical protein